MKHLRMQKLTIFMWWVVLALAISGGCEGCLVEERMALLQLKASLSLPNINSSAYWHENDAKISCCEWNWVECSQRTRRVIKLTVWKLAYVPAQNGWYLNASTLLHLKSLRSLDLYQSNLKGWVENEGIEKLSSLRNLQFLNISWNSINRNFLSPLNQLSNLRVLRMSSNKLIGSIDLRDFHGLNNLKELDLSSNNLNSITAYHDFHGLNNLKELDLNSNNLNNITAYHDTKGLPCLISLKFLDLSTNYFNSNIFSFFNGLQSLETLYVANNQLEGSICLEDFHGLNNLKKLDLRSNNLRSIIACHDTERCSSLTNMKFLDLSENYFNNSAFSSLSGLQSLKTLLLFNNSLKGSVSLTGFRSLEELDMSYNKVDSLIKRGGIKSCSKLKILWFRASKFNASKLLQSLGSLSSLKTLNMEAAIFQGRVTPQVLGNLSQVEELFLDGSSIDESFIENLGPMNSLKVLSAFGCVLNHSLHQGFCQLENLKDLGLGYNNFEGAIPSCFGNLSSLTSLDISQNKLRGNIAPLKSLTSLEFLELSDNFFQIPLSFSTFANHSKLDVFIGDNSDLVAESLSHHLALTFQPKVLVLRNCRFEKPLRPFHRFLYDQHALRIIDLSHTSLGGGFLSWLLRNNTRLNYIKLRNNSFVGTLDLPFHPNPLMSTIDFSHNHLQGPVPTNMSSLFPNLSYLNLSRNEFFGNISLCLKNMKYLMMLDLSNNNFSGIMPQHLGVHFLSLFFLKLSNNKFHGEISPEVFDSKLESLHLDGNNFTGEVPMRPCFNYMMVLDLSDNHFIGKLPSWIGNTVTSLKVISMSKNHFHGAIPIGFCNLNQLSFLDLSENNLSGVVPSCFNLPNIRHVHLQRNSLQGQLTHAFSNSSFLVTLDLKYNNFSGQIPKWIGNLSALSTLSLKANHFSGEVPNQLCYLRASSILDLSENNFSSSIPSCLSSIPFKANSKIIQVERLEFWIFGQVYQLKGVDYFYYSHRIWEEDGYPILDAIEEVEFTTKRKSYSYKGDILNFMSGIDLSCNQLIGEIPIEIGAISTIHALNLSFNNLTGSIPTSFSNLKQLESLDLSHNKLNGRIPSQLTELNFLAVFSVAYNNLSGPTPDRKARFATFRDDSYEGNPLLCGPPLQKKCHERESTAPSLDPLNGHDGEDTSFVDMEVFYVSFVVAYIITLLGISVVLYINPYWRRVWLYYVEIYVTTFYYFVKDHFPNLPFPK